MLNIHKGTAKETLCVSNFFLLNLASFLLTMEVIVWGGKVDVRGTMTLSYMHDFVISRNVREMLKGAKDVWNWMKCTQTLWVVSWCAEDNSVPVHQALQLTWEDELIGHASIVCHLQLPHVWKCCFGSCQLHETCSPLNRHRDCPYPTVNLTHCKHDISFHPVTSPLQNMLWLYNSILILSLLSLCCSYGLHTCMHCNDTHVVCAGRLKDRQTWSDLQWVCILTKMPHLEQLHTSLPLTSTAPHT